MEFWTTRERPVDSIQILISGIVVSSSWLQTIRQIWKLKIWKFGEWAENAEKILSKSQSPAKSDRKSLVLRRLQPELGGLVGFWDLPSHVKGGPLQLTQRRALSRRCLDSIVSLLHTGHFTYDLCVRTVVELDHSRHLLQEKLLWWEQLGYLL